MITYIRDKGYATGLTYITSVMRIINQYNLTKYDQIAISNGTVDTVSSAAPVTPQEIKDNYYRVAQSYSNGTYIGQIGAYTVKENAIAAAEKAHLSVFDPEGNQIYAIATIDAKTIASEPSKPSTQYQVRCGIFTKKQNATKLIEKLKKSGFDALMYQQDDQWYVQAGKFEILQNADKLCSRIMSKGFDCVVVTI